MTVYFVAQGSTIHFCSCFDMGLFTLAKLKSPQRRIQDMV